MRISAATKSVLQNNASRKGIEGIRNQNVVISTHLVCFGLALRISYIQQSHDLRKKGMQGEKKKLLNNASIFLWRLRSQMVSTAHILRYQGYLFVILQHRFTKLFMLHTHRTYMQIIKFITE